MQGYIEKIRELSKGLLSDCRVDLVIGFRKGTLPLVNEPCFITSPDRVGDLVWDGGCGVNLANYLAGRKENIGIIAKGCDSRNIVNHIIENQIKREQLVIIGAPCTGMIDRRLVASNVSGEIQEASETEDHVTVKGDGFEESFARQDVLRKSCMLCVHRNPVLYDELVAEPVPEQTGIDRYADVRELEAMSSEKKWTYFEDLLSTCIRCYACRNACPLCYCPVCFVDESRPQWVGKTLDPVDTRTFHFLRAYHCAGRCTDCGSCEQACPMGIDVRAFTRKLEKDCNELYGWEAGLSIESRPPLDTYKPEDPEDFIK